MLKKLLYTSIAVGMLSAQAVFAFQSKDIATYVNGPTITAVSGTSAVLSLSPDVLKGISDEEKSGLYFEYGETHQVCIMIYPTPESCLPKKTELGKTQVTIMNLKPNTSYTVTYKKDNTIRCITTPCPGNDFESLSVEFTTASSSTGTSIPVVTITQNMGIGSRGSQVATLQTALIQQGYLHTTATGYFGVLTFKAVQAFQSAHSISAVGLIGPLTRAVLNSGVVASPVTVGGAETFEGTVTAYSTQCFVDGECSITVDGKKVVTTTGRSQVVVGTVTGIPDFGSIENNVGAHAKVYAKKTDTGYTLYGNADYYVAIAPLNRKLPGGSAPAGGITTLASSTWVWQKTVMADGSIVTPAQASAFTVALSTDGKLSGTTDCNGFFGNYSLGSDGFITFGPMGSTMMFCENSQESVFTGAVSKTTKYAVDTTGTTLTFTLADNAGVVYLTKK